MKNLRLEGVLDGLGRNMKAAFEPEFPGQSVAQGEAKDIQNNIGFWRLFLMQARPDVAVLQAQYCGPARGMQKYPGPTG